MKSKLVYPEEYKIEGLRVVSYSKGKKKCYNCPNGTEHISYATLFCRISVAQDSMGTQICSKGAFFGSFKNVPSGVEYLKSHKKEAIKFFTKVSFSSALHRIFSKYFYRHIYWKVRHHFDPTFYFS